MKENSGKKVTGADNQQERLISNDYLAGFTDGEGTFYIGFSYRKDLPLKWQIITEFHVSQNPSGRNVLEYFARVLCCGYLKPNHAKNPKDKTWIFIVKDRKDLEKKVIPFFKKHQLHTGKKNDFKVFCQILEDIHLKKHLTKKGFTELVNLVFNTMGEGNRKYLRKDILSRLG
jgi:hypothetical protein